MSTFAKMAPALRGHLVPYAFRPLTQTMRYFAADMKSASYFMKPM
jgi:hypothetical protein